MTRKRWLYPILIFALLALIILASGLRMVHFNPGKPLGDAGSIYSTPIALNQVVEQIAEIPLWKQILFIAALLTSFILFVFLLPAEMRKRLMIQAIRFALAIGAIIFLIKNRLIQLPGLNLNSAASNAASSTNPAAGFDASHFSPPLIAPWIIYLVSLGVTLALLALIWAASRFWMRHHTPHPIHSLDEFANAARSSLNDLASGRELEDVVIQLYARMSEIVAAKRGLHRAENMTPHEFAERLSRSGLPTDAVSRLTRLFESVRYGSHKSNQADVNEATDCLRSILDYCGVNSA